jgi:hypothetical protein
LDLICNIADAHPRDYSVDNEHQRNFVFGRAIEHCYAAARLKRWPNKTANWAFAMDHSRGGMIHSFSVRFKTK